MASNVFYIRTHNWVALESGAALCLTGTMRMNERVRK